jgi:hypothetical protein
MPVMRRSKPSKRVQIMRTILATSLICVSVAGCGSAAAVQPDSSNPAHCIAAMNFSAYWLGKGNKFPAKVVNVRARGLFEAQKIKASGGSLDDAKGEAVALTKAYGKDLDKMDDLFLACAQAEDRDPAFQAQLPDLLATVRNGWKE